MERVWSALLSAQRERIARRFSCWEQPAAQRPLQQPQISFSEAKEGGQLPTQCVFNVTPPNTQKFTFTKQIKKYTFTIWQSNQPLFSFFFFKSIYTILSFRFFMTHLPSLPRYPLNNSPCCNRPIIPSNTSVAPRGRRKELSPDAHSAPQLQVLLPNLPKKLVQWVKMFKLLFCYFSKFVLIKFLNGWFLKEHLHTGFL